MSAALADDEGRESRKRETLIRVVGFGRLFAQQFLAIADRRCLRTTKLC